MNSVSLFKFLKDDNHATIRAEKLLDIFLFELPIRSVQPLFVKSMIFLSINLSYETDIMTTIDGISKANGRVGNGPNDFTISCKKSQTLHAAK